MSSGIDGEAGGVYCCSKGAIAAAEPLGCRRKWAGSKYSGGIGMDSSIGIWEGDFKLPLKVSNLV